jgi:hypothetical protein
MTHQKQTRFTYFVFALVTSLVFFGCSDDQTKDEKDKGKAQAYNVDVKVATNLHASVTFTSLVGDWCARDRKLRLSSDGSLFRLDDLSVDSHVTTGIWSLSGSKLILIADDHTVAFFETKSAETKAASTMTLTDLSEPSRTYSTCSTTSH